MPFQGFYFTNVGFEPKKFLKVHSFQQAECLYLIKIALDLNSYHYSASGMAEREETMIEIIQEENWDNLQDKKGLPKNIKQIGTPDMGDRIYIENSAYQKLHPYGNCAEKTVYVMMGRFDDFAGHICIFVEDAIKMDEIGFNGKLPVWNDDSWGGLYRKIRPEHENMIIVGWAIDICGQSPSMTAQLERIHQTYFGGIHQVLLLMDTLEREEVFFGNRNGYLKRREGFYIYYDQNIPGKMESFIETLRADKSNPEMSVSQETEHDTQREERYRSYLNSRQRDVRKPKAVHRSAGSSVPLLLVVILALGYTSFQNYKQMKEMERVLNRMELQPVMQTEVEKETIVSVEDVLGNVTPDQSNQQPGTQIEESDTSDILEPATQTISEAETYREQGYYIVQAGDNLAGICRKIYHTAAMMDALCEVNDIEDPDAIFAGQRLRLPN